MTGYGKIKNSIKEFIEQEKRKLESKTKGTWYSSLWKDYFYHKQELYKDAKPIIWHAHYSKDDNSGDFLQLLDLLEADSQRIQVWHIDDTAAIVGYGKHRYIVPAEYVEYEPLADYKALTSSEMISMGDKDMTSQVLPANVSDESLQSCEEQLEDAKARIKAEEEKTEAEIERLREELYQKQRDLREELEARTASLKAMKEELEKKIYVLDTQIYGIRCYMGEVIDFHKIRDGKPAPIETPVVIHQKIRYLDEELGRYFALYHSTDQAGFIEILKYRDDMRDLFCPTDRAISVIRISRSGTVKAADKNTANLLKDYDLLHGTQIAILIRDGERLYIGWTDEEKINIHSENLFLRPGKTSVRGIDEREETIMEHSSTAERVSRYFILSILQGMADNLHLMEFPEHISVTTESQYVIYSFVEGWITDNRYGTLEDILKKCQGIDVTKDEEVLTSMRITRDYDPGSRWSNGAYDNDRGIGEKNRTHGAHINGETFYKINKVLKTGIARVKIKKYPPKYIVNQDKYYVYAINGDTNAYDAYPDLDKPCLGEEELEIKITESMYSKLTAANPTALTIIKTAYADERLWDRDKTDERHRFKSTVIRMPDEPDRYIVPVFESAEAVWESSTAYISVPMESAYYNGTNARCNFEIMSDEYIRTDYLCSTWIEYVITTGHIGYIRMAGSSFNYADMLKYLNLLLEHLKEREKQENTILEEAGLKEWVEKTPDWDRVLCEWRIENKIHALNKVNVRSFAKAINKK